MMGAIDGEETRESDIQIKQAYRDHAREVDVDGFAAGLRARLASASRRTRRRPLVRRLSLAAAGLLVACGLGIGTWQAAQHLTGPGYVLVIGDAVETTNAGSDGLGSAGAGPAPASFSSEEPRSVSELKLADLWRRAAVALDIDPRTARLNQLEVSYGGDGVLAEFNLTAVTPDGRVMWLSGDPELTATDGYVAFRASISSSYPYPGSANTTGVVLMTVEEVLTSLEEAGLMEIAFQSGVEVVAAARKGVFGPDEGSAQVFGPNEVVSRVLWTLNDSYGNLAFIDAGDADELLVGTPVTPVILSAFGERLDRLGITDLPSLSSPVEGLTLGRTWTAVDKTTGQETSTFVGAWSLDPSTLNWTDWRSQQVTEVSAGSEAGRPRQYGIRTRSMAPTAPHMESATLWAASGCSTVPAFWRSRITSLGPHPRCSAECRRAIHKDQAQIHLERLGPRRATENPR
jgi:hypothetical protein